MPCSCTGTDLHLHILLNMLSVVLQEKLADAEAQLLDERKHLRHEQEARKKVETENQYLQQASCHDAGGLAVMSLLLSLPLPFAAGLISPLQHISDVGSVFYPAWHGMPQGSHPCLFRSSEMCLA